MTGTREILIIEDNPADVRLIREALRELVPRPGIHVAATGDQALEFLKPKDEPGDTATPSLIFLDFNLPGSNSREILRHIKEDDQLRMIPVVILTASEAAKDVRDAYQLHANCYLRKPGDLDSFLTAIRAAAHFWLDVSCNPSDLPPGGSDKSYLL